MGFGDVKNKISFIEKNNLENWPSMNKRQIAKKLQKKLLIFLKKNKLKIWKTFLLNILMKVKICID